VQDVAALQQLSAAAYLFPCRGGGGEGVIAAVEWHYYWSVQLITAYLGGDGSNAMQLKPGGQPCSEGVEREGWP